MSLICAGSGSRHRWTDHPPRLIASSHRTSHTDLPDGKCTRCWIHLVVAAWCEWGPNYSPRSWHCSCPMRNQCNFPTGSHVYCNEKQECYRKNGNVQFNWPKLFQAFSVKFTVIFFHKCVHSIIPHQHIESKYLLLEHFERNKKNYAWGESKPSVATICND